MGGGKGGGGTDYSQQAYDNAFNAAQRGQSYDAVKATFTGPNAQYGAAGLAGFQAGGGRMPGAGGMHEGPDYAALLHGAGGGAPEGPSYEEQMADQQAMYDQQLADAERAQGIRDRDMLYSSYLDSANTAAEYIASEIAGEQSNAALLGIDYNITDEQKSQRINDYFATVWGAGDQARLEGLFGQWGNPTGFTGFTVTRGDASKYASQEGEETKVGETTGVRPTLATEDEETLGAPNTVLGG